MKSGWAAIKVQGLDMLKVKLQERYPNLSIGVVVPL
jgi:hypothetical protein